MTAESHRPRVVRPAAAPVPVPVVVPTPEPPLQREVIPPSGRALRRRWLQCNLWGHHRVTFLLGHHPDAWMVLCARCGHDDTAAALEEADLDQPTW